jgi:cytochrome c1
MRARPVFLILSLALVCLLPACVGGRQARGHSVETGGDARRGAQVIAQYRCGACHIIPGIQDANGLVGPPLMMFGRRTFVGGEVPNTPDNLVHWIRSPQSIEAGTAMPALGLTEQQARDAAAYLYTLR